MYIPHLAAGGGFTTALHLMNPAPLPVSGIIEFFADDGQPLPLSTGSAEPAASFPYSIALGGVFSLETTGSPQFAAGGWARITPAEGEAAPFAAGAFRLIYLMPEGRFLPAQAIPINSSRTRAAPIGVPSSCRNSAGGATVCCSATNPA